MAGKYLELEQGLTVDPEDDYPTLKSRLLEAASFTKRDAGTKYLQASPKDISSLTALEVFQISSRLTKRMFKCADTVWLITNSPSLVHGSGRCCLETGGRF